MIYKFKNRKQHFLSHSLYCIKHNLQGIPLTHQSQQQQAESPVLPNKLLTGYGVYSCVAMEHLPYTPKLAPRNFHQFFGHNKLLAAKQFASCHLLATDTWHRYLLCWDTKLDASVGQMLACPWWLCAGLMCTTCYLCVMYTSKSGNNSQHYIAYYLTSWNTLVQTAVQFSSQCTPIITRS